MHLYQLNVKDWLSAFNRSINKDNLIVLCHRTINLSKKWKTFEFKFVSLLFFAGMTHSAIRWNNSNESFNGKYTHTTASSLIFPFKMTSSPICVCFGKIAMNGLTVIVNSCFVSSFFLGGFLFDSLLFARPIILISMLIVFGDFIVFVQCDAYTF